MNNTSKRRSLDCYEICVLANNENSFTWTLVGVAVLKLLAVSQAVEAAVPRSGTGSTAVPGATATRHVTLAPGAPLLVHAVN